MEHGRLPLANLPTPIQKMERFSAWLGTDVWVKRDDLTGLGLTGNKVRKLEYLLADAVTQGADTVLTTGGLQSNHCRATVVACRQLGLEPVILLRGVLPEIPNGNVLIDTLMGATIHTCTPDEYRDSRDEILQDLAIELVAQGKRPYIIPEGGSNGLGALAYARACDELWDQGAGPFSKVVCAVGSGGTVAGLAIGSSIGHIVGIPVCDDAAYFRPRIEACAHEAEPFGVGPISAYGDRWSLLDGYQGPAYAVAESPVWQTIARVARLEGLLLDPVYTGKAMHALVTEVQAGRWQGPLLFWHTGGSLALFGRGHELVEP